MGDMQSVSLWELACWTYAKQQAHRLLQREGQAFEWAIAATGAVEGGPRPSVAWDAAMLHGCVAEIGEQKGIHLVDALVWPASIQQRPELPDEAPRCGPVEITGGRRRRGDRFDHGAPPPQLDTAPSKFAAVMARGGRGYYQGRRIEMLIRTLGFVVNYKPVFERRGRTRWKQVGTEPVWTPIEFCPLQWTPDPGWHAATIGAYTAWRMAMGLLWDKMQEIELRDHRLTPEEIPEAPPTPLLESNAWDDAVNEYAPVEVTVGRAARGEMPAVHLFGDPIPEIFLAERRARAAVSR